MQASLQGDTDVDASTAKNLHARRPASTCTGRRAQGWYKGFDIIWICTHHAVAEKPRTLTPSAIVHFIALH